MDDYENVQNRVKVVRPPESIEHMSSRVLNRKDVNEENQTQKQNACDPRGSFKEPCLKLGKFVVTTYKAKD